MLEIKEGKPYLWKSDIYGNVAVHIASVNDATGIIRITVDGGESARVVIDHPELKDGHFVVARRLHKRPARSKKETVDAKMERVNNAVVTTESAPRPRRLAQHIALKTARAMADHNPERFNWPTTMDEGTF
jgi:hypothetical protein